MRAVHTDELRADAPVTMAAVRKMRSAATPFPDVPVVILSAASAFPLPRRFRPADAILEATAEVRASGSQDRPGRKAVGHEN